MRTNIWLGEIPSTTWSDFVLHGIIILGGPLPLTDLHSEVQSGRGLLDCGLGTLSSWTIMVRQCLLLLLYFN